MTIVPFLPTIELFIFGRFLIGFFREITNIYVLSNEFVGPKYRPILSNINFIFWACALCVLPLKAYLIQNWQLLYVFCSAPYLVILMSWWFVPESPRWLLVQGRKEEAMAVLRRVAHLNRRDMPEHVTLASENRPTKKMTPVSLFTSGRALMISTLIQGFGWFSQGLLYWGITMTANDLGGDMYFNWILFSLTDFPACLICIWAFRRLGRKITTVSGAALASCACVFVFLMPLNHPVWGPLRIATGTISKLCVNISINGMFLWSVELYPTSLRVIGNSCMMVMSRIGAASSPWLTKALLPINPALPFALLGIVGLMSTLLFVWLPETKSLPTKETLDEKNVQIDTAAAGYVELKAS